MAILLSDDKGVSYALFGNVRIKRFILWISSMYNKKFFEELSKSLSQLSGVSEIAHRQNAIIASMEKQLSEYVSSVNLINFSIQIPDIYSSLQINTTEWAKALEISSGVFNSVKASIDALKKTYHYIYNSPMNVSQAVKKIEEELGDNEYVKRTLEFIKNSKRGILSR